MAPPEVILDRHIKAELRRQRGCSGYVGKLDIDAVQPPSFRVFLQRVQESMNQSLLMEGVNASGGTEHDPFHFDYIEAPCGTENAHAVQTGGFAFIAVTLPMIQMLWNLAERLSRSAPVLQALGLDAATVQPGDLQVLLFELQMNFLVSHEYTHHVHLHDGVREAWSSMLGDDKGGGIASQAEEIDADGYAIYLSLAYLLRGGLRAKALQILGRSDLPDAAADEALVTCLFLALMGFFCSIWRGAIDVSSIYQRDHPPPPMRIKYAILTAEMWAGQNASFSPLWFRESRFKTLFSAAAAVMGVTATRTWDAPMVFLRSADGYQYDQQLFERFDTIRRNRKLVAATSA